MADENDDLLDAADIEALLNEAGAGQGPSTPSAETPEAASTDSPEKAAQPDEPESDQLSQADLDNLLAGAGAGGAAAPASPPPQPPADAGDGGDLLDPGDIEKLLNARTDSPATPPAPAMPAGTEELLRKAEEGLAAAISPNSGFQSQMGGALGNPQPFEFSEFGSSGSAANDVALRTLHDVELDIRIELGRTELLIDEVLQLRDGSVVPLDKLAGDPVDVIVNDRLIARGEVLVLNDNFCVRITEILPPQL